MNPILLVLCILCWICGILFDVYNVKKKKSMGVQSIFYFAAFALTLVLATGLA